MRLRHGSRRPRNVRLVLTDGREVPVGVTLAGVDDDGITVWDVVTDYTADEVSLIKIGKLPGRTSVAFRTGY